MFILCYLGGALCSMTELTTRGRRSGEIGTFTYRSCKADGPSARPGRSGGPSGPCPAAGPGPRWWAGRWPRRTHCGGKRQSEGAAESRATRWRCRSPPVVQDGGDVVAEAEGPAVLQGEVQLHPWKQRNHRDRPSERLRALSQSQAGSNPVAPPAGTDSAHFLPKLLKGRGQLRQV